MTVPHIKHILLLFAAFPLLVSCPLFAQESMGSTQNSDHRAKTQDTGPDILTPFKRNLQQALQAGLAEGPVEAITACQLQAPEIAEALSRDDIRVGRTSHRLRNPSNRVPMWVAPILDAYAEDSSELSPRTVQIEDDRMGYVEPIIVQPLCLTCHGSRLSADVAAQLQELYPEDRATGYEAGDLRGVFWVEYPRAKIMDPR